MPKISAEARRKKEKEKKREETVREEQRRRGAGYQCCWELPRCAANSPHRELEASWSFQRWYRNSKTRSPWFGGIGGGKKRERERGRAENIVPSLRQSRRTLRLSESNGGWSETSTKESRAAESKLFLRCAPEAALMASVLGNSSRASGAQSGQVKCKLKRRRRRRSKRKGTTLQHFFFFFFFFLPPSFSSCLPLCSASRGRAHLGGGIRARGSSSSGSGPTPARCLYPPRAQHAPRPLHFTSLFLTSRTWRNGSCSEVPPARNDALSLKV